MKNLYSYLTLTLLSVLSLSSCGRADYAFKSGTGSYHTTRSVSVAKVEQPAETFTSNIPDTQQEAVVATIKASQSAKTTVSKKAMQRVSALAKSSKHVKPSLVEKALISKLVKKASNHSEAAGASQQQSKAGKAGIVIGVSLLLLLLGGAAEIGIIALIGLVGFIVGLVLLIGALVNS